MPTGCFGCSSPFKPRYMRLVDNVYPTDPADGIVRNNMEKLTFYVLSCPEKLDRVGEYIAKKIARDIHRKKTNFVVISIDVLDQLLVACHAQSLNLFVESFLGTIQKLLETQEPKLQILATQSFVKFANIEEDTPSYHLSYDFFVSKFSSMCYSNNGNAEVRTDLRMAGLQGIQGVIRKTVSDELVENIWSSVHMDKILPSLLFNMQDKVEKDGETPDGALSEEANDPATKAESCFREVVERAALGRVATVLRPILNHLDSNNLWVPNTFAIQVFRIIMFSVQAQYSYTVVQILIGHLNDHNKSNTRVRIGVADVLSKIITISAKECVGPSVLEIINSLVNHLSKLVRQKPPEDVHEKQSEEEYQRILIEALGAYAHHLPDYQKIEVMKFIASKIPLGSDRAQGDSDQGNTLLQIILLRSLLQVGTTYKTQQISQSLEPALLEHLLKHSNSNNCESRLIVQQIFHTLIDRHNNASLLTAMSVDPKSLDLRLQSRYNRGDATFFKKQGIDILEALYRSLEDNGNTREQITAIYTTVALMMLEVNNEEIFIEVVRMALSAQEVNLTTSRLTRPQKMRIYAMLAALMAMVAFLMRNGESAIQPYIEEVIKVRVEKAPFLLPPLKEKYKAIDDSVLDPELMFNKDTLYNLLEDYNVDAGHFMEPFPGKHTSRSNWIERPSLIPTTDSANITMEVDSVSSSPGMSRPDYTNDFPSFESIKKLMTDSKQPWIEAEEKQQREITKLFFNSSFGELVEILEPKTDNLHTQLEKIFQKLEADEESCNLVPMKHMTASEISFPDLFMY